MGVSFLVGANAGARWLELRRHGPPSPGRPIQVHVVLRSDSMAVVKHNMSVNASREQSPSLLGVFAHPDDETICAGGTFAKYASAGAEVRVISFTRGEAGQIRRRERGDPDDLESSSGEGT